ncbi:MAG: hypothetical protein JO076_15975 [Verrucomicrobia bacterium]|nr:hypothetical protein [Verrucomicrobiota bacterium]
MVRKLNDNFDKVAIQGAGYGAIWHGQKSWNGVAILLRTSYLMRFDARCWEARTIPIAATLSALLTGWLSRAFIYRTVIPRPGPKFDYKLRWFERFIAARDRPPEEEPVYCTGGRF